MGHRKDVDRSLTRGAGSDDAPAPVRGAKELARALSPAVDNAEAREQPPVGAVLAWLSSDR